MLRISVLLACLAAGCGGRPEPVVLLSIDGFRYDYLARGLTPVLAALAAEGAVAPLVPSFPTKTFPNHYTVVTGLYPGEHGIVSNTIWDPATGDTFSLANRTAVGEGRWWGGEPVWVAAERAGRGSAVLFWPGSEAPIQGVRPARWFPYDHTMPNADRADSVLAWLALPPPERPAFIAWYLPLLDEAGHDHGPDAPETDSALAEADRTVGRVVAGLEARGQLDHVRLVIVSDHGMSATSRERVVALDDYVPDLTGLHVLDWSPFFQLWGDSARLAAVMPRLRQVPHLTVWWRDSTPARFHYREHARIAPVVGVVDDGWTLSTRARADRWDRFDGGNHGFADTLPSMRALFLARGPGIRPGVRGAPFGNVHVYALLMRLLALPPAVTDARVDSIREFLQ